MGQHLQRMWGFWLVWLWFAGQAMAGTLAEVGTGFCDWRLSGPVAQGDLQAVSEIRRDPMGTTLCLEGAGGDLAEGLAILRHVRQRQIRTRVLQGRSARAPVR